MIRLERDRAVRRVLLLTLALNLLVALAKLAAGAWFHVLSLTADGVHSSLDALNNVVGLFALGAAAHPADPQHPYGHRKFETLAALGIGVSLGLMGAGLAREAVHRVRSDVAPESHPVVFVVAVLTLVVNLSVASYEARRGRELFSEFLSADAQHTRGDVLVTLTVLGALLGVALDAPMLDLAAALLISLFIARVAWRVISHNLHVLADAAALPAERVAEVVLRVPGVRGVRTIRSRGPPASVFVDLRVQVDPSMTTEASHALGHQVSGAIQRELPGIADVVVHVEPSPDPPSGPASSGGDDAVRERE